jgi:hypothetical protein
MALYRGAAATATAAVGALLAYAGVMYPWLAPVLTAAATAIGTLIGKQLGIPIDGVLSAALAEMAPARAVAVTAQALRSMPPANVAIMLASLPPASAAAATRITFAAGGDSAICVRTLPATTCKHAAVDHGIGGCRYCGCDGFLPFAALCAL